jgi:hypothetical protein
VLVSLRQLQMSLNKMDSECPILDILTRVGVLVQDTTFAKDQWNQHIKVFHSLVAQNLTDSLEIIVELLLDELHLACEAQHMVEKTHSSVLNCLLVCTCETPCAELNHLH